MGRKKERAGMAKGEAVSAINGLPEAISPYVRLRASRHEERKKKGEVGRRDPGCTAAMWLQKPRAL